MTRHAGDFLATLAPHLGVATATVGQRERGQRRPDGAATKLLSLVQAKGLDYIRLGPSPQ